MEDVFNTIRKLPENGLKYKYLTFSLSDYRIIQDVFNQLMRTGDCYCCIDNVVSFFALEGFITCKLTITWIIKVPEQWNYKPIEKAANCR